MFAANQQCSSKGRVWRTLLECVEGCKGTQVTVWGAEKERRATARNHRKRGIEISIKKVIRLTERDTVVEKVREELKYPNRKR